MASKTFFCIDAHTCGNPVRLVAGGGPVLQGFSEALMIGIVAGTYSSIYISSAIALDCGLTAEHVFPSEKKAALDHLP